MENNGMITLSKTGGGKIDIKAEDIIVIEDVVFVNPSENWTKVMISSGYTWSVNESRKEIIGLISGVF